MYNIFLLIIITIIIGLSGLFSGFETGMYQLSRLRLRLGVERRIWRFILLGKTMRDSSALLLSILIGNNLTHYIITSIATFMLLSKFSSEHTAELTATFMTAPILFIFAELIPKSIFYHRADSLMPALSPILLFFHKVFTWCGAVYVLRFFAGLTAKATGSSISTKNIIFASGRPHIKAIYRETEEEGFLSRIQNEIFNRLVSIPEINVQYIMTPMNRLETIELKSDRKAVFEKLKQTAYTRIPVYDRWAENVVGWINIYKILTSDEDFKDLSSFLHPIGKVEPQTDVITAIRIMQREKHKILLVSRSTRSGKQTPLGIITMKDLAEELLGELSEW